MFSAAIQMTNIGTHNAFNSRMTAAGLAIRGQQGNCQLKDASNNLIVVINILVTMAATNTCTIAISASGSTKTIGIGGSASAVTYFSGHLVA